MWVYSGRRGVHCWVCDENARKLSSHSRAAVAEYLTLISGGENQYKKVRIQSKNGIHPSIKRAAEIIKPYFAELVEEQRWLEGPDQWKSFLQLIPDEELRCAVEKDFCKHESPITRWKTFLFRFDPPSTDHWKPPPKYCKWCLHEILIQLGYPRLDVNVTKGLNHLLKSPFCIHPKTGKVAVPLDLNTIHLFDPDRVPRIDLLLNELSEKKEAPEFQTGQQRKQLDYKRTSLADYVDVFEKFVDCLVKRD